MLECWNHYELDHQRNRKKKCNCQEQEILTFLGYLVLHQVSSIKYFAWPFKCFESCIKYFEPETQAGQLCRRTHG